MITIRNVSPDDTPNTGPNDYIVTINGRPIAEFTHDRQANGMPQCLRDAADAVEEAQEGQRVAMVNRVVDGLLNTAMGLHPPGVEN